MHNIEFDLQHRVTVYLRDNLSNRFGLMTSIGVIRAMVVFPQSHHYPPQRGGTLVTAGRRPADIQSSTINHQPHRYR